MPRINEFCTYDLYLASALTLLLNIPPQYRVTNGRTIFIFPISDDLYNAVDHYNGGTAINALQYSLTLKRLRSEMMMRRNIEAETGKSGSLK